MAKKDNSAAVDNDEYFQEPIIIPKLDLYFLLHVDGKSINKSSSNSDISVLLYSEHSMFYQWHYHFYHNDFDMF